MISVLLTTVDENGVYTEEVELRDFTEASIREYMEGTNAEMDRDFSIEERNTFLTATIEDQWGTFVFVHKAH